MLTFSQQKTGLPVSYIQLANIGVAITQHTDARVACAVFHDAVDGAEFGKLMARQLLDAFIHVSGAQYMAPCTYMSCYHADDVMVMCGVMM